MIFIKDVLHQATVRFALSQSAEQSPKNLPACGATLNIGRSAGWKPAANSFFASSGALFYIKDL